MKTLTVAIAAIAAAAGGSAQAATLAVGGGWSAFMFGGTGSSIIDIATGTFSYNFTLGGQAQLQVTDAYLIGDTFAIFNAGTLVGNTGPFNPSGATTGDPDQAFASGTYSTLSALLGPGTYSITGTVNASPYTSGTAYIQLAAVTATVPEPASWAMMLGGLGLVGAALRGNRRRMVVSFG